MIYLDSNCLFYREKATMWKNQMEKSNISDSKYKITVKDDTIKKDVFTNKCVDTKMQIDL